MSCRSSPSSDSEGADLAGTLGAGVARAVPPRARWWKGLAVDLQIWRQRELAHLDEMRRHHELGQLRAKMVTQRVQGNTGGSGRRHVGDQALVPGVSSRASTTDLPTAGCPSSSGLDLAQLDAIAAQLHLLVGPAEEFDVAVAAIDRHVPGPVEASVGTAEWVAHEAVGGEIGPLPVSASDAVAADVQVSRRAHRHRLHAVIEDVQRGVGDRPSDGDRGLAARDV